MGFRTVPDFVELFPSFRTGSKVPTCPSRNSVIPRNGEIRTQLNTFSDSCTPCINFQPVKKLERPTSAMQ